MYTQCSHCEAIFRVSMKEITAASGQLRCGECNHTFEAMETLSSTLPGGPGELNSVNTEEQNGLTGLRHSMTTEKHLQHPHRSSAKEPSKFSNHEMEKSYSATPSQDRARKYMFIVALGLVLLLLLQTLYSARDWFAHQPMTSGITRSICKTIGCTITPQRDPTKIKVLSRNVFAHPNEPGSLIITSTIKNQSSYKQQLPLIEVSFLDKNSNVFALRRFRPEEYTQKSRVDKKLFQPNETINFRIKIKDPGSEAVTFQFNFL